MSEWIKATMLGNRHEFIASSVLPGVHFDIYKPNFVVLLLLLVLMYWLALRRRSRWQERGDWEGEGTVVEAVGKIPTSESARTRNAGSLHGVWERPRSLNWLDQRISFRLQRAFGLCCWCALHFHNEIIPSAFWHVVLLSTLILCIHVFIAIFDLM